MARKYLDRNIGMFLAAEDLRFHQYRAVQLNGLNAQYGPMWQKPTGSSDGVPTGVLRNSPISGGECIVQVDGIAKVYLGGSAEILPSRPVGVLPDGSIIEGGNFGVTVSGGEPGDIIEVLLGGGRQPTDNFVYEVVSEGAPVHIPEGQQMTVHGCLFINEGQLYIDGTFYIED